MDENIPTCLLEEGEDRGDKILGYLGQNQPVRLIHMPVFKRQSGTTSANGSMRSLKLKLTNRAAESSEVKVPGSELNTCASSRVKDGKGLMFSVRESRERSNFGSIIDSKQRFGESVKFKMETPRWSKENSILGSVVPNSSVVKQPYLTNRMTGQRLFLNCTYQERLNQPHGDFLNTPDRCSQLAILTPSNISINYKNLPFPPELGNTIKRLKNLEDASRRGSSKFEGSRKDSMSMINGSVRKPSGSLIRIEYEDEEDDQFGNDSKKHPQASSSSRSKLKSSSKSRSRPSFSKLIETKSIKWTIGSYGQSQYLSKPNTNTVHEGSEEDNIVPHSIDTINDITKPLLQNKEYVQFVEKKDREDKERKRQVEEMQSNPFMNLFRPELSASAFKTMCDKYKSQNKSISRIESSRQEI